MPRTRVPRRTRVSLLALLCCAAAGGAVPLRGQSLTYDSSWFKALKWRNVGPNRGGRSLAVAGSATRPLEYYFGATGGGLWKTTDGGTTWKPVTDGQIHSSSVGAVAVAASNPDVVYVGMGETELRGNIMQGDGVYKTTDAGKTWQHLGLENTQAIARIRVHPTNPDVVYVAAFGHPMGPNAERGIYRSRDGGRSWQRVLFRNDGTGAIDLVMDPSDPNTLYASLWDAGRRSWTMWSGGPGSGLFKSTDGGESWKELTRNPGLPKGVIGKIGVAVSPADPKRIFAMVENDDGGLFRSDDAGATWTKVNDERKLRQRAFYYSRVYADPKDKDVVYVLNVQFWKSTDGGKTFPKQLRPPHGDNHDLWIASNDPQRMIEANDGGGTVSTNGGETWTDEDYPTAQLYHIATTKDYPYHVCGAQQDNSTMCAPSREAGRYLARGSGGDGAYFYAVGGGESGYIAPDPKDPNVFYAGSQGALLSRYDRTIGQARDIQVYPRFFSGEPASALKERWQWTYPIVFSPLDPNVLYTSSQHLWKTTNQGMSWERISPDLTLADPKTLGFSGGPITHDMNGPEIYGTIFTIAPSYHDANTIWTGSDDGLVQITRDGGRTWTKITPPGLPKYARISMIDASRHDPATAYVAAKLYQVDDRAPYIFRTHDFGRTWTKIVTGIGAADFAHVVREDPKRKGLLYAGTEHGIYVSFDDGDHWQSLSLNLPDVQVSDLVVEENDVVIATHGRSAYVLDDVGPLRQLGAQVAAEPVHLFQPRTATRRIDDVAIDYYLRKPADTVTVEILGPNGALVRRFLATAADTVKRDSTSDDDERPRPAPPGRAAGLNRFTWRPRYPAATSFPKMVLWGADRDGPWAPPGRYQVRLSANGVTQTQGFEIRKDPRLTGVTEADLAAQFELASKIRDRVSAANEGVVDIRALKDQITERLAGASGDRALAAAGRTLADRLSAVEEELYQVRNRSSQDPLNFPIKLNNRLAALERIVESADGRPTQQSYTVFNELSAELDQTLGRLRAVMEKDVPAFDRLLAERHLPALGAKPAAAATSTQQ